jgi:Cu2+-exporting ATPase
VAQTILASGLGAYYETRTAPAAQAILEAPALPLENSGEAHLILQNVQCSACLWLIEAVLRRVAGVKGVLVNYATQRAHVEWDPSRASLRDVVAAVNAVGYGACPYDPRRQQAAARREGRKALWRLFVAGFAAMQAMMYAFPAYIDPGGVSPEADALMRWAGLLVTAPVLAFSCAPFFAGAALELRQRRFGLDLPIALGLALGFAASAWATLAGEGEVYFDSIAMIAFLLLGARALEGAARRKAVAGLDSLYRTGDSRVLVAGEEITLAPGETIPADGIVIAGESSADESLLTGESRPVPKRPGDELTGGSVNLGQPLAMRVTRAGADTRAAQLARLAERGAASRPRLVEDAERLARGLTPAILFTAAAAGAWWGDAWVAVAVLVAACPCAVALAAPVILTRAGATALGRGVLLARARALQALAEATDVVLDKTGTLTTGRLACAHVEVLGAQSAARCRALAAALESSSRHPIARAFPGGEAMATTHVPGRGIEGQGCRIGNEGFCREIAGERALPPVSGTHTRVYLARQGEWLAAFDLQDELRPGAARLVAGLQARGIAVTLASGDAAPAVAAVAARLGIADWRAGMAPEDKLALVAGLQAQGRVVAMVGDGFNDAPVLARADAAIAVAGGADAAQLRADVVLLGASLEDLDWTLALARRAMRLARQNLAWALAYNLAVLPLAAGGFIGPWEAALGMGASSLAVLLNALRPLDKAGKWKAFTSSSPSPSPSYS